MIIRPYEPADRAAVREICCATADRGEPVESFFPDRELIADLVTRYYTDFEPEHSWVAVECGRVVGYVNGGIDEHRYRQAQVWRIGPGAVWRALGRGLWASRSTWRMVGALVRTAARRTGSKAENLREYPGQLHVNLQREARGGGTGRRLVERFEAQARAGGCPGLRASVRGDNEAACRFFEKLGYRPLARHVIILPRRPAGWLETEAVVYAKKL